jgi:NhaC family Na+:H+ antiporter
MAGPREKRDPYLWEALISILALVTMISLAIVRYESDAHVPILIGVLVAALMGLRAGFSWKDIETGMLNGITNSLQAIVILGIIGILIGVWILSGVVPTLLYYGLKILHPKIFLPATLIICSITSLATGTSWGTAGTIGIALIGIGSGLGFPCPSLPGRCFRGLISATRCRPCPTPPTWRRPWWAPTCIPISST